MTAKLKYLLKEYRVASVLWINMHCQWNKVVFPDCVVMYEATEEQFYVYPGFVIRKFNARQLREGGYEG